eukprot:TRINITY_DN6534_c0_g1_i2.p1 TRINITY_DN6534_c0_g1~~TRINITY_DN6534_c0_g1_i2.p1  ORF type:complete len:472 (+),score=54.49 TRINITY_DN6534_c0_g1_i2:47-1462(+)
MSQQQYDHLQMEPIHGHSINSMRYLRVPSDDEESGQTTHRSATQRSQEYYLHHADKTQLPPKRNWYNISRAAGFRQLGAKPVVRLITRSNPYSINLKRIHLPFSRIYGDLYHTLLDQPWWRLFALITIAWLLVHITFACLYFADRHGINNESQVVNNWADCFFFSVQTMETIGYGRLNPGSYYTNIVVCCQAYLGTIMWATFSGLIFAKIARPSRQKRYIIFSEVAVINDKERWWDGGADEVDKGRYQYGNMPCLVFRFANMRKSQLCDTSFHLLLVRREPENLITQSLPDPDEPDTPDSSGQHQQHQQQPPYFSDNTVRRAGGGRADHTRDIFRVHELNFEINTQVGRVRGNDLPSPLLGLPWSVIHVMDHTSPLYGATPESLRESNTEIIGILDGLYEGSANSVQARWSWTFSEIIWNAKFVDMVGLNSSRTSYVADYSLLSQVRFLADGELDLTPVGIPTSLSSPAAT